jgi:hypothetical protein
MLLVKQESLELHFLMFKLSLQKKPDAGNINGSPRNRSCKFLVNGGFELSDETSLYYN